jgi:hypothetical protein
MLAHTGGWCAALINVGVGAHVGCEYLLVLVRQRVQAQAVCVRHSSSGSLSRGSADDRQRHGRRIARSSSRCSRLCQCRVPRRHVLLAARCDACGYSSASATCTPPSCTGSRTRPDASLRLTARARQFSSFVLLWWARLRQPTRLSRRTPPSCRQRRGSMMRSLRRRAHARRTSSFLLTVNLNNQQFSNFLDNFHVNSNHHHSTNDDFVCCSRRITRRARICI